MIHSLKKPREKKYSFQAKLWKVKGPSAWHFVTLPKALAMSIREVHGSSEEGWGRLKATATMGDDTWDTSIWFDTKAASYLLPIKATLRKRRGLKHGSPIEVILHIPVEVPRLKRSLRDL